VLVLGGASWDTLVRLDRFPEPRSQTVFGRGSREAIGATGAGKALNLRGLGMAVTFHAMLGEDQAGARIREALDRAGIAFLSDPDPAGTERHVNLMDADGGRISIYVSYPTPEPKVDEARLLQLFPGQDAVALNISNYCRRLIPALREAGRPLWVDVHDWNGSDAYHRDFAEAADFLFLSSDAMPDHRPFMERMIAGGKSLVVCTHGRHGSTALTREGTWIETPIAPGFDLRDSNGAGDAFFSGVLHGWGLGCGWQVALRLGTLAAGLCVASDDMIHPELGPARLAAEYRRVYGADPA
jgi:sugar/nucleoside kinase (ribokinase family)